MSETVLNQRAHRRVASDVMKSRRAMRLAVARSVIVVGMCACAAPFAVSAQATANPATQSKTKSPSLLLAGQAQYGAPLDGALGGTLLIPTKPWRCEDGLCGAPGVEFQALAGLGGWRVAGGVGPRRTAALVRRAGHGDADRIEAARWLSGIHVPRWRRILCLSRPPSLTKHL
jgi:hypothetical protein